MLNDRKIMRWAVCFALAALPALASSQPSQNSTPKPPDWQMKAVTQVRVSGSTQQLKDFMEALLPTGITKGLAAHTIILSPRHEGRLVYSFLTDTEASLDNPNLSDFYAALKASTKSTPAGHKPPLMGTAIYWSFGCRIANCGGQLGWAGRRPPCDC